jgi:predicted transcriptional regulator
MRESSVVRLRCRQHQKAVKQNITIELDKDLLRRARVLAAERTISLSELLAEQLASIVAREEWRDDTKRKALAGSRTRLPPGRFPGVSEGAA